LRFGKREDRHMLANRNFSIMKWLNIDYRNWKYCTEPGIAFLWELTPSAQSICVIFVQRVLIHMSFLTKRDFYWKKSLIPQISTGALQVSGSCAEPQPVEEVWPAPVRSVCWAGPVSDPFTCIPGSLFLLKKLIFL
jgi:hypothetical protein